MTNIKMNLQSRVKGLVLAAAMVMTLVSIASADPLKIFIMTGQSNMQGKASPSTLPAMAKDPKSKALHDKLVDENGDPRIYEDVYLANMVKDKFGPLTLAKGNGSGKMKGSFGPEMAFGVTMQEKLDEPFLIVKIAWGGKDLILDFRPPSAGKFKPRDEVVEWMKAHGQFEKLKKDTARRNKRRSVYYKKMMNHVKTVLSDPGTYHPDYDPEEGYEIAGFVWFQGYNDMISGTKYDNNEYDRYSKLLTQFIRDIRKNLNAPDMPFLIGVLGIGGKTSGPFQKAMAEPAENSKLDNVVAVYTGKYWDHKLHKLDKRNNDGKQLTAEEKEYLKTGKSNGAYHYLGSAKIYSRIGEAFANTLFQAMKEKK